MATYADLVRDLSRQLIATFKTKGEALAVSKALDRDRAVDESATRLPFSVAAARDRLRLRKRGGCYGRMKAGRKLLP